MLGLGVFGFAVDKGLDLVELVYPDDAPGVLAVTAGLTPETAGPPRIAQRPVIQIKDFAGVIPGDGHLRSANQIEVVLLEVVHLIGVCTQKSRAAHDFRLNQYRRDQQGEAVGHRGLHRQLQQAQL